MFKPKIHLLVSGIAVALLLVLGFATREELKAPIRWSERALNWGDFPPIPHIEGDYEAMVHSTILYEGNRDTGSLRIFAQMDPNKSGKVNGFDHSARQLLVHEQYHFNITEYCARLLRKEAVRIGKKELSNERLQNLRKKYLRTEDSLQYLYDTESNHNLETDKQRYWELEIDALLRQTAYYAEENIYDYHAFTGKKTQWYRHAYFTVTGKLLTSYPENEQNSRYGKVYHIEQTGDSTIIKYFLNGKPFNGGYFDAPVAIISRPDSLTNIISLQKADGSPHEDKSYSVRKNSYDPAGNLTTTYYTANGERVAFEGIYLVKRKWDPATKSMYATFYDKENEEVPRDGASHELRQINEDGVTVKIAYFDSAGKPAMDNDFVSVYEYETTKNFKVKSSFLYGPNGEPAYHIDSFRTAYEYDERGEVKRTTTLSETGQKSKDVSGISSYEYTRDLHGNITDVRKYNLRGLPVIGTDFHHEVTLYDSLGRLTFNARYYPGHVLHFSESKEGAVVYEYVSDTLLRKTYKDGYNFPMNNDDGVGIVEEIYTARNRLKRQDNYDMDGCWAKTATQVTSYVYKYDEKGNLTKLSTLDSLGQLRPHTEDVAITRWEYDANGNKTKTIYYNKENELANASGNVTYNVFEYDSKNLLTKRENYDRNMRPIAYEGAFRFVFVPNRFGRDSIVDKFDVHGRLFNRTRYHYSPLAILLSEGYYDRFDAPTLNENGVQRVKYLYDKNFWLTGTEFYGNSGERVNNAQGFWHEKRTYSASGFLQTLSYYDKNDQPVPGPEGYHKLDNFFNDADEIVRSSTYGPSLELENNREGIADFVFQKNTAGMATRISFYDEDGNAVEDADGIAEYRYYPSLNGLYYVEKQLDALGNEVVTTSE